MRDASAHQMWEEHRAQSALLHVHDGHHACILIAIKEARVHNADSVHALLGLIEPFCDAELLLLDLPCHTPMAALIASQLAGGSGKHADAVRRRRLM